MIDNILNTSDKLNISRAVLKFLKVKYVQID